ncbi:thioesterase [Streptomyces sioyaensis]|nr:alpha/beta fold hydrolase [Streptomyces sioyaensis]MBM4795885.1 thioesterase [Streptomyces sioyaensis]
MFGITRSLAAPWWTGEPAPLAERTLLCLPYAGGGPQTYRRWGELLGPSVEVLAMTPPGRGRRYGEEPCRDLPSLLHPLTDALPGLLHRPYVLFGHSLGATVAYELCLEIRRRGLPMPQGLVVSGRQAPDLPWRFRQVSELPADEFTEALRDLGGTPEAVLAQPELMSLLMPALRADFAIVESYRHRGEPPLDVPILALAGTEDDRASADHMAGWADRTTASFALHPVHGGHFFVDAQAAAVTELVSAFLSPPR